MPNPTEATTVPAVLECLETPSVVSIDSRRWHVIENFGIAADGSPTISPVYLSFERDGVPPVPVASAAAGTNRWILSNGRTLTLPPGIGAVAYVSDGDTPTIGINPLAPDASA